MNDQDDNYDYAADYAEWKRGNDKLRRLYLICDYLAVCNILLMVDLWL